MKEKLIIRKRVLDKSDIALIKELIANEGSKGRTYISKRLCEYWDWRQSNGHYREITCRELLGKLDSLGIISLPPILNQGRRPGYKNIPTIPDDLDRNPLEKELKPLKRRIVFRQVRGTSKESCFNGLIEGYHYLGYCQGAGEQLKYLVFLDSHPIACIGFGISALKVACRDKFIGWNAEEKDRNLHKVVNNSRFLILPWVRIPHLASFILGQVLRRINRDWVERYRHCVVLVETFVDSERFSGVCYRASNWRHLGLTTGRGRNDRHTRREKSVKAVFVRELCPNFREECHV
ncbi:MAG: DUF4338 domain-containing protein [Phycisphaerae bacterium]|nr:DUF4338 domain-containing protein [Phycisphaerae bacterium]